MSNIAQKIFDIQRTEDEVKHIRNISSILKIAVSHIDKATRDIVYFEEDEDSEQENFISDTIEISYLNINVWIDIEVRNDSYTIIEVDVKNSIDEDYLCLSTMLKQDLIKYYDFENVEKTANYNQYKEIIHDQGDFYNIKPKMPNGYESVYQKHVESIKSICEDEEENIKLFIIKGFGGKHLKLKKGVSTRGAVKYLLPIILEGNFDIVNRYSNKLSIAQFISANFKKNNGKNLSLGTLHNEVSKQYASA